MNAPGHPGKPWRNNKLSLDLAFILSAILLALVFFSTLRVLLYVRNLVFAEGIPATELLTSFLIGVRFDLIAVCIGILPLVVMLLLKRSHGRRRIAMVWFSFYCAICLFMGIVELEFYHEFQTRLNNLAAQYLKEDPVTVLRMLWYGFPVLKYLALWTLLVTLFILFLRAINIRTTDENAKTGRFSARLAAFVVMLILVVAGARGTLRSGPPLRWGDAYHSQHLFANHLPLNAAYTFVNALRAHGHQQNANKWLTVLDEETALQVTRDLLSAPGDIQIRNIDYPIERIHSEKVGTGVKNVVLILMESFSAEFVGALGKDKTITPYFNELAKRGILFNNFFSNGTHTHQGMFATVACFPNLPGYEYLMQEPQGQNQFSGLPVLLGEEYNDVYVYNGEFSWDNQEGFFRNQGVTSFFGRNDYVDPKFIDPTWGVSDEDMFDQALIELDSLAHQDKPFYAILQTLSNHVPYALPDELPFKPVTQHGRLNDHLTAQKYSDWALGQFFNAVERTDYYDETLFVVVGDHGFGLDEQLSGINALTFHVPLLIIGKDLLKQYDALQTTVGTQVDIVPTIAGLLGNKFRHQCWGRDLLGLDADDKGFGIIKPSGGSQTVAMIEGEYILVSVDGAGFELGEFHFAPKNDYRIIHDELKMRDMTRKLKAYIQTALLALTRNHTGVSVID